MKQFIYLLIALLSACGGLAVAQETPPTGLKPVNSQFYINSADSSIWQNKGIPYGWQRLNRFKEFKDSLKNVLHMNGSSYQQVNGQIAINGMFNASRIQMFSGYNPDAGQVSMGNFLAIGANAADRNRSIGLYTGSTKDWEFGEDAAKKFYISRPGIDSPLTIDRTSGVVKFARGVNLVDNYLKVKNLEFGLYGDALISTPGVLTLAGADYVNFIVNGTNVLTIGTPSASGGINANTQFNFYNRININNPTTSTDLANADIVVRSTAASDAGQVKTIPSSYFAPTTAITFYKDTTISTNTTNTIIIPAIANAVLISVTRSGATYYPTSSTSPTGNKYYFSSTAIKFQDNLTTNETISVLYKAANGTPVISNTIQVATFSDMVSRGTPQSLTIYKVASDENKSYTNSTYLWWPNGKRLWVASTDDN